MLSFKEKRIAQQELQKQNQILLSNPSFLEKRKAQQAKQSLLLQLDIVKNKDTGVIDPVVEQSVIEDNKHSSVFYEFNEDRKPAQRKRENKEAALLLEKIKSNEIDGSNLTNDQKAILAKYSGLGGKLTNDVTGDTGSSYEYYTPQPIAKGMWDLARELGFSGGSVLDPSSGTGIISSQAGDDVVMDAVELDGTSGLINKLVNSSDSHNVTIAPFEKVAANTPDGTYDMVITNVPFGDSSARGDNFKHDKKYQKESLQGYFILRSLEKLKPGGLAIFIVPPSVISGRAGKEDSIRVRMSYMAEFLGAYRLPSKVFNTASTETITDVIALRKFNKETLEKISELKEQSPETLVSAKVQWQEFIDGRYFSGEGHKYVLGTFVPKDPNKFRDINRVTTNASIGEIGAMLRKFPGSRIDWNMLDAVETDAIIYKDGDIITQAGQTLEWKDGRFVALGVVAENTDMAAKIPLIANPYEAFLNKVDYESAISIRDYMTEKGLSFEIPGWLKETISQLKSISDSDKQKVWACALVGLSCDRVLTDRLRDEIGVNFLAEYTTLSEAMQRQAATAKEYTSKIGGDVKVGLKKITQHYSKSTFSALWRGDVLKDVQAAETNEDFSFDGLRYKSRSHWTDINETKEIYGDDFNPFTDPDWCISADGSKVTKANDYYVGNYSDFLRRINGEISNATDQAIIDKLVRQKTDAESYVNKVNVKSINFNLHTPHVTPEEKAQFLRQMVHKNSVVIYDEETGKKRADIDVKITKDSPDIDKLYNRFGDYLKNGTISLGGIKIGMKDIDALRKLRSMVETANEQFNTWAQANAQITNRLEEKANDPAMLSFKQVDESEPLKVPGMSDKVVFHGYQNSFIRQQGREFGGINGFDVGLGKTFSALAASQYAQAMGIKKKTIFVVPNSVLSNWKKESSKAFVTLDDCLFVGLRVDKKGNENINSSAIDDDLVSIMENRHSKIYVTFETFERIKLRDETIFDYESYLGEIDSNYQTSSDVKEREAANAKKESLISVLSGKTGAAPYLEDLGIDSIVIDEAHGYKNSARVFEFKSAKFLSMGAMAKRGIDAQAKAWYIRGKSDLGDGVLLLTATPITNSPIEVYSMLSLAKGHKKVNSMMLGINGADDFMNMVASIENVDDVTIDGQDRTTNVFVGLKNVDTLRMMIDQSSVIKSAKDVGNQVVLPEREDKTTRVSLTTETIDRLQLYKAAFRWAIDDLSEKKPNRGDINAYKAVEAYFGENQNLIGHPFNLINKMTVLIADPELDKRATFFTIPAGNLDKAKIAIAEFNKSKITEKRPRKSPYTKDSSIKSKKVTKDDESGDSYEILTTEILAELQDDNKTIIIDTMDSQVQQRWDSIAEKHGLELDVTIPPKLAALIENVQYEIAHPRGIDDDGNHSPIVKQIIFSDMLATHSKIKRLLAKKCGIKTSQIAIITGKTNNTADEIMSVQDGFNAHGDDNVYRIIIANEKAEVGVNLQKGTQAIHHLSIGWTPDSLTQRNGRGVRQGNKTVKVAVYTYDADGTFDEIKRELVNKKASWIEKIMAKDGDNNVDISGGLTREQIESLIDVTGDSDATSKIQKMINDKEAEKRALVNINKQKVNIDTIKKQREFVAKNDPAGTFAIPKIVSIYTLKIQISSVESRIRSKTATERAIEKNTIILNDLNSQYEAAKRIVSNSVAITDRGGYIRTAEEAIKDYTGSWTKGNKYNAEGLELALKDKARFTIQVIDGSELHTDWLSQVDMAKSMIDSALKNYLEQSKLPGALHADVGLAFSEGKGHERNGDYIITGSIAKSDFGFGMLESSGKKLVYIVDKSNYGSKEIPSSMELTVIKPGSAEYEGLLIEAARLEDETGLNVYSDVNSDVTKYRVTPRLRRYEISQYELPQPYIPTVLKESEINGDEFIQYHYDKQSEIVSHREDGYYFSVPYEMVLTKIQNAYTNPRNIYKSLIAFARASNKKLKLKDEFWFNSALSAEVKTVFDESDREVMQSILRSIDNYEAAQKAFEKFISEKIFFIDFSESTHISDFQKFAPWGVKVALDSRLTAINDTEKQRLAEIARVAQAAHDANTAQTEGSNNTEETVKVITPVVAESDPTELVNVGGNTSDYYKRIKEYAISYGGGKYRWNGKDKVWVIQRKAWDKMIKDLPHLDGQLNLVSL